MHPRSALRLESVGPWLEEHGFYAGDRGLLAAALERPWLTFDGQDLYPDVWPKAAALQDFWVAVGADKRKAKRLERRR